MTEKKQYILGINLPLQARCHESGVALIDMDGNVLFAVNEERLSRKKLDGDFPVLSIKSLFEYTGVEPEEIKYVAVPTLNLWQKALRFAEFMWRERRARIFSLSTYRTIWRTLFGGKKPKDYKLNVDQEQETFTLKHFCRIRLGVSGDRLPKLVVFFLAQDTAARLRDSRRQGILQN